MNERPDPDKLLQRVQTEEQRAARGKLKIFFGMAPGVGKTFAMLQAARREARAGVDVIIGYVEPHARPETQSLTFGLDLLPRRAVAYRDRTLQEFDLEAALARKPQLILVDELAHTNAEGLTHARRWQDVEDLLAAGISVYTTLNVQHLESLNDVIAQVTSAPVRETVPDHVFENADEVELIDVAPDELIDRLRSGKVYVSDQAARAIQNFFRKGNLIALRELALRRTADRVSAQAVDYRQQHAVAAIWPTADRLLVCVGPSPMSARLVRATRRIASTLRAPWTALHVELTGAAPLSADNRQQLEANLKLAEELGAQIEHVAGADFADCVLSHCRQKNISRIIVGKPLQNRWREFWHGAPVYDLIRRCGDIDVFVISGDDEAVGPRSVSRPLEQTDQRGYFWSLLVVVVSTLISWSLSGTLDPTNLAMIYMAGVVFVSLTMGRGPSILATVLSIICFDVGFVPPYGRLSVSDSQYLVTFTVMMATGLLVSQLAERVRRQSLAAREREQRTAALYALSRELAELPTAEGIVASARRVLKNVIGTEIVLHTTDDIRKNETADDIGVIRWVLDHRQPAGAGTSTLPGTGMLYVPLVAGDRCLGCLGIASDSQNVTARGRELLSRSRMELLEACAAQIAAALERCELAKEAENVRIQAETERLRNSLLSAVSHDLRTPLATLTGAASTLAEQGEALSSSARKELAESMVDESDRLHRLVANLLELTRLEAGAIQLHRELQPIDEVIGVALARLHRQLRHHPVVVRIASDLPPVLIDELLMQQVLVNLLENAAKFSDRESTIELVVEKQNDRLVTEVMDRGQGLPRDREQQIFDKFVRGTDAKASGSGIGLAICRAIVELHGGTIEAHHREGGGSVFRFTIPVDERAAGLFSAGSSKIE
ncbi:MAG: sensor histidine kinase KdpD [Planctomycetaceae bacterium]|nr:sensor histidine kinase KdpD [Planctomycetaceae bacterium]